jgi:hypothetical protein
MPGTKLARGLDNQMEMVGHQAKAVDLPIGFGAGLGQGGQEELRVAGVADDAFGMVTTVHSVVNCPWIFGENDSFFILPSRGFHDLLLSCKLSVLCIFLLVTRRPRLCVFCSQTDPSFPYRLD